MARPIKQEMIRNQLTVDSLSELNAYSDNPTEITQSNGTIWLYVPNSTATADNVMFVSATGKGAGNWHRQIADKRLTPQVFGAVGDGTTDDGPALLAWLNMTAPFEHFLPAGDYKSSIALPRVDKGAITLSGAGSGCTSISFTGNTSGISLINTSNSGPLGQHTVRGIKIKSRGVKGANTVGLYICSQEYQRPGPVIEDIAIDCTGASNEQFAVGIQIHDSSGTSLKTGNIRGFDWNVMTGLLLTNSVGRPCYEHNFIHLDVQATKIAVNVKSAASGNFGIEGVKFKDCNLVGNTQGLVATSPQGSPDFGISGCHINSMGAECLYLDGYQQVHFSGNDFYSNPSAANVPAPRAVYINNAIGCDGMFQVITYANTPNAVELDGFVALTGLRILHVTAAAPTNSVKVFSAAQVPDLDIRRQWNNNTTWGTTQGVDLVDASNTTRIPLRLSRSLYDAASDGSLLRINKTLQRTELVSPLTIDNLRQAAYTADTTIDGTVVNEVIANAGASPITFTINYNTLQIGQKLRFKRLDANSTGIVSIQMQNSGSRFMQRMDGSYTSVYHLTIADRHVEFFYDGANMQLYSGSGSGYSYTVVSANTTIDPSLANTYIVNNSSTNITITVDQTKLFASQRLTFLRINDTATGTITLTASDSAGNLFQKEDNTRNATYVLGSNVHSASFLYVPGTFYLLDSVQSVLPATQAVAGVVKLPGERFINTASASNVDYTINMATEQVITVHNTGTGTVNLVFDTTTGTKRYYDVMRYDNTATGTITMTTLTPAGNKIQDDNMAFQTSVTLAATAGKKHMRFFFNGTHLQFAGY